MNKVYEPNPITLDRVRIQKYFIQGITLFDIKEWYSKQKMYIVYLKEVRIYE